MNFHRLIFRLFSALALGALTTISVAWGLAAWLPHQSLAYSGGNERLYGARFATMQIERYQRSGFERRNWFVDHPGADPWPLAYFRRGGIAPVETSYQSGESWGRLPAAVAMADGASDRAFEEAFGWPRIALWCNWEGGQTFIGRLNAPLAVRGGLMLPEARSARDVWGYRALPYRPIWPGLLLDIAAYAVIWLALIYPLSWLRRQSRLRRNLCPRCAYSLSGTGGAPSGCPECGWNRAASPSSPAASIP